VIAKEMLHWNARFLLRRLTGRNSIHLLPEIRYVIHGWASHYIRMTAAARYFLSVGGDRLPLCLTLFRSAQVRPGAEPDLGWGGYVATVKVVDVPGDHETMLHDGNRQTLVAAMREALGSPDMLEEA
jgi:thioesterase domain-containing protein